MGRRTAREVSLIEGMCGHEHCFWWSMSNLLIATEGQTPVYCLLALSIGAMLFAQAMTHSKMVDHMGNSPLSYLGGAPFKASSRNQECRLDTTQTQLLYT